jgi:hypothetical protein
MGAGFLIERAGVYVVAFAVIACRPRWLLSAGTMR